MPGESVGLDLASQTGQTEIAEAIEGIDTSSLASQTGQTEIAEAIEGIDTSSLANQSGQQNIVEAIDGLIQGFTTMLNRVVLKTTDISIGTLNVIANGTYDAQNDSNADAYDLVVVNVPNTYETSDEGKVVSNGSLVAQTSDTKTSNGTYDTTLNNEIVVAVDNSYSSNDEGKVVSNGSLVAQTSDTKTSNGTYDTTLINSITVAIPLANGEEF